MFHESINDLPPEILSSIFSYLSNSELLNLSRHLLHQGLSSSAAKERYLSHSFIINKESLHYLYRLSRCSAAASTIESLVIIIDKFIEDNPRHINELFWHRHLLDYDILELMPACLTMMKTHKVVNVRSWKKCKTCAGESPTDFYARSLRNARIAKLMEGAGMNISILDNCLKRFSNLREVRLTI